MELLSLTDDVGVVVDGVYCPTPNYPGSRFTPCQYVVDLTSNKCSCGQPFGCEHKELVRAMLRDREEAA